MNWIIYAVIAIALIFIFKRLLPSPKSLNAATNALLAEHLLRRVELVQENQFAKELGEQIINVWRLSGFPNITDSAAIDSFNEESRFVQLNIIAMALNELGHSPHIANEYWQAVSNPLLANLGDDAHISAVSRRLKSNYGEDITIPERQFKLVSWGLSD